MPSSIPIKGRGGITKYLEVNKSGDAEDPYRFVVENYIRDPMTPPFLGYLTRTLGTFTLAQPTVKSTFDTLYRTAVLSAGHGLIAGDECVIADALTGASGMFKVMSVDTNTITVDRPWDYAFPITSVCKKITKNLAVDGSSTPLIYGINGLTPSIHLWALKMYIVCSAQPDDGKFGDIAPPSSFNGLCIRIVDGFTKNIGCPKTNGELRTFCANEQPYSDRAPAGAFAVNILCKTKELWGWTAELSTGSYLQAIVQDDLSTLLGMYVGVMGHIGED